MLEVRYEKELRASKLPFHSLHFISIYMGKNHRGNRSFKGDFYFEVETYLKVLTRSWFHGGMDQLHSLTHFTQSRTEA